jgi:hypothetical protein
MNRLQVLGLSIGLALLSALSAAEAPAARTVTLDIAPQPLGDALSEFAKQAGMQIVFHSQIGKGTVAPGLNGAFTLKAALEKLLANTELEYSYLK